MTPWPSLGCRWAAPLAARRVGGALCPRTRGRPPPRRARGSDDRQGDNLERRIKIMGNASIIRAPTFGFVGVENDPDPAQRGAFAELEHREFLKPIGTNARRATSRSRRSGVEDETPFASSTSARQDSTGRSGWTRRPAIDFGRATSSRPFWISASQEKSRAGARGPAVRRILSMVRAAVAELALPCSSAITAPILAGVTWPAAGAAGSNRSMRCR
jgi:hypothetical protein